MISVVIPLFNKALQIEATLQSVMEQSFTDFEVIIVNDASTDNSESVVQGYLSQNVLFSRRVRLINQEHAGVAAARNMGITESRYSWIAFLDADDLWHPTHLQALYQLGITFPYCNLCATAYDIQYALNNQKTMVLRKLEFIAKEGVINNYFQVALYSSPPVSSSSCMVRKEALLAIGNFPDGVYSGEDLLTWARLAILSPIAYNKTSSATIVINKRSQNQDQRDRLPQNVDVVGLELERLYRLNPKVQGIKAYLSKWHKMRMHIFLTKDMKRHAFKEWGQSFKYDPFNYKLIVFFALIIIPVKFLK